jgi:hypothetical protein
MIRGVEHGPKEFLEQSHDLVIAKLKEFLHPTFHPTIRAFAEMLAYEIDFRICDRSLSAMNLNCDKEADKAAVQTLTELRDEIIQWLDETEVKSDD